MDGLACAFPEARWLRRLGLHILPNNRFGLVVFVCILFFWGGAAIFAQEKEPLQPQFTREQSMSIDMALELLADRNGFDRINLRRQLDAYSVTTDRFGYTHVKFSQTHPEGVSVFKKRMGVHLKNNKISFISGHFEKGLESVNIRPDILEREAVEAALDLLNKKYQDHSMKTESSELVILGSALSPDKRPHLVWCVVVSEAVHRWNIFVDAHEGGAIMHYDEICTGTGSGDYTGSDILFETNLAIVVSSTYPYVRIVYRMEDSTRNITSYSAGYDNWGIISIYAIELTLYKDEDDYWGGGTDEDQNAAVDAHYHAAWTYDYFYNEFGRDGLDGSGGEINIVVHLGSNYNNALWDGTHAAFGDGDGNEWSSLATMDIVGHEMTHGVVSYTADLVYEGESGGLNEAFADIFGTCVEHYGEDHGYGTADWWAGEDAYTPGTSGDALRYLDDPTMDGESIDHYSDYTDEMNVHYSSGIANNAFYLLSEGGTNRTSGISVTGIGIEAASQIFYRALAYYLEPDSTFRDCRLATLQSASDIYGDSSTQYESVEQAWNAVGVVMISKPQGYHSHAPAIRKEQHSS